MFLFATVQTPQGRAFSFQDGSAPTEDFFASPDMHAMPTPIATPLSPSAPTPLAAPMAAAAAAQTFTFTPEAAALVARHAGNSVGLNNNHADGLDFLMQSCTHMLKVRMGMPATPLLAPPPEATVHGAAANSTTTSEMAMDAVGPVLETVLASLTGEYERRLLAKDQEHKHQADEVTYLKRQVAILEKEAAKWKDAADSGALQAAAIASAENKALKAQEKEEYARLCAAEGELLCQLAAKRRELEMAQAQASALQSSANKELGELRASLERYRGMDERYKSLKEENRELYNTVQDLRGSIRVFCRVRPQGATGDFSESVIEVGEDGALAAFSAKHNKWHEFKFDKIFGEDSRQAEIFQETKPLCRSVLEGYNVCIFAYGQTGSGKTHTMSGTGNDGINFRALEDLFQQREERAGEVEYTIRVQLVEIYNEVIRDLLVERASGNGNYGSRSPSPFERDNTGADETQYRGTGSSSRLGLVATRGSGNNLPDATQLQVYSAEEVAEVMIHGSKNRATAETKMNERSSRSHQVLTVIVEGTNSITHAKTRGCLHLIDLAGSERVSRSGAAGQQLIEAQHINKSLTALGCVMQALAQKRDHIPFRDSKLTFLLADSLAGQAKSMMFMHVAPEESSVGETLSTLNFGSAVTKITLGAAKQNVVESGSIWEARHIKEKLSEAKREVETEREARRKLEEEVAMLKAQLVTRATHQKEEEGVKDEEGNDDDSTLLTIPAHRPSDINTTRRPPQVGRLNLSKLSSGSATPERAGSANDNLLLGSARNAISSRLASSKIPTPAISRNGSFATTRSPMVRESLTARAHLGRSPVEAKVSLAAAAAQSMMLPRSKSSGLSHQSTRLSNNSSGFRRSNSFGLTATHSSNNTGGVDNEVSSTPRRALARGLSVSMAAVPTNKGRWC